MKNLENLLLVPVVILVYFLLRIWFYSVKESYRKHEIHTRVKKVASSLLAEMSVEENQSILKGAFSGASMRASYEAYIMDKLIEKNFSAEEIEIFFEIEKEM